jgi:hypothetical protein
MSASGTFKESYLAALSLPPSDARETDSHSIRADRALARAHELRKFEIENYWKRATYFWAFQVAAFGLFGLIWKEIGSAGTLDRLSLLIPAGLGAVSAQVGWLTARGSKFWQENWEAHVDLLEGELEGRLTQVVLSKSGRQYSVSAVNQNFMLILMVSWVVVFLTVLLKPVEAFLQPYAPWVGGGVLLLTMTYLFQWSRTGLRGMRFRDGKWSRYDPPSIKRWLQQLLGMTDAGSESAEIVLRDTMNGPAIEPKAVKVRAKRQSAA